MAKQIDFSPTLPEPKEVDTSAGSGMLRQAAAHRAQAAAIHAQRTEDTIKFLGTAATELVKGKAQADLDKELSETIKKTQFAAAQDIAANNKKLGAAFLESGASDDFMGDQTIAQFRSEAQRYAEARAQGLISNDEAIMRMGEAIKRYTAQAPGWATEFRKIGAEKTGISNLDVYGLHKSLLDETAAQNQAAISKKNLELQAAIAKEYGYARVEDVPAEVFNIHRQRSQTELEVKALETQRKVTKMNQEDATMQGERMGALYIATGLSGVMEKFVALHKSHLSATTSEGRNAAQRQGAELSATLDVLELQLSNQLRALASGPNAMDSKRNQEMVDNLHKTISGYKEYVKTAEGYNWFIQNAKNVKGDVSLMMDKFVEANPLVGVWKELGIAPQVTQAYFTMLPEQFKSKFTKEGFDTFQKVLGEGAGAYMRAVARVGNGGNIGDEADPDTRRALINDVHHTLQELLKKQKDGGGLSDQEQKVFANFTTQFAKTWVPTDVGMKAMKNVLLSPEGIEALSRLRPDERAVAVTPIFDKLAVVVPNTIRDVQAKLTEVNAINKERGYGNIFIRINPLTRRLEAVAPEEKVRPTMGGTEQGAVTGRTMARRYSLDDTGRAALKDLNKRLDVLNLAPDFIQSITPLVRTDVKPDGAALTKKVLDSINSPDKAPTNIVSEAMAVVPRNVEVTPFVPGAGKNPEHEAKYPTFKSTIGAASVATTPEERAAEIQGLREEIGRTKNAFTKRLLEQALKELTDAQ